MNMDVVETENSTTSDIQKDSTSEGFEIRPARKTDKGPLAELMYSSGADIYDYIHSTGHENHALDYIRSEFENGRGLCTWKLLTVAVMDGNVVATGTFYDREGYTAMSSQSLIAMMSFYGMRFIRPLRRAMDTMKLVQPPRADELYLANFGVSPKLRGTGIGSYLLKQRIEEARDQGYRIVSLDVATHNPRAEALYHRLGFAVTKLKSMKGRDGKEYACKKMELFL